MSLSQLITGRRSLYRIGARTVGSVRRLTVRCAGGRSSRSTTNEGVMKMMKMMEVRGVDDHDVPAFVVCFSSPQCRVDVRLRRAALSNSL
jgi:hypothetical protein